MGEHRPFFEQSVNGKSRGAPGHVINPRADGFGSHEFDPNQERPRMMDETLVLQVTRDLVSGKPSSDLKMDRRWRTEGPERPEKNGDAHDGNGKTGKKEFRTAIWKQSGKPPSQGAAVGNLVQSGQNPRAGTPSQSDSLLVSVLR